MNRLSFPIVLGLWVCLILFFGCVYFFLAGQSAYLLNVVSKSPVSSLADSIYFSFVAATTTGFGDIVPFGWFKILAVLEVVSGLLILAFVTSKLVSIKQDALLNEVYEISFNEKINRIRASLVLFRQNVERVISKVEDDKAKLRDLSSIGVALTTFEESLNEISNLVGKNKNSDFLKNLDSLRTELIFNSVLSSFNKINELFVLCESKKLDWRSEVPVEVLKRSFYLTDGLFSHLSSSKALSKQKLAELNSRKTSVIESIKQLLKE